MDLIFFPVISDQTTGVVETFPAPFTAHQFAIVRSSGVEEDGYAQDSFNVDMQGTGSFTGLSYQVPAHTSGTIKADIETPALTSQNVKDLNTLIDGLVSASAKEKIDEYQRTHASANISAWSFWTAGGSASYEKTRNSMHESGLSDDQITMIVEKMLDVASTMSKVSLKFKINNSKNDYAVSGSLMLYTISGTITTQNGTAQYRLLADSGSAGSPGSTAPANGNIIPLT
jgi:hypothetical protein